MHQHRMDKHADQQGHSQRHVNKQPELHSTLQRIGKIQLIFSFDQVPKFCQSLTIIRVEITLKAIHFILEFVERPV